MMYFLIVVGGLAIAALLFAQLRNETRAQNNQVKTFFDNLAIWAYCSSENEDPSWMVGADAEDSSAVCPIVSTSITCGRQEGEKHQLDFPVSTADTSLKGTAAEFSVEPDGGELKLYVRLLEQPYMWISDASGSSLTLVVSRLKDYEKKGAAVTDRFDSDRYAFPKPAFPVQKGTKCHVLVGRQPLRVGDRVMLGNTLFVIGYNRREG